MLKQLPIKKEYLLLAGSVLLLVIGYQLAFRRTAEAWQLHSRLEKQLAEATSLHDLPAYLERKNHNLDEIVSLYKTDTTTFRSNAISEITSIAEKENVKLSEVPTQDPMYYSGFFIIQKLDFEGDYFALTKMYNQLQSAKGIGVPRSAIFKVVETRSSTEDVQKLVMEVYLEAVK